MYRSVIHELAHASHWEMSSEQNFDNSDRIVKESWAEGVERFIARDIFGSNVVLFNNAQPYEIRYGNRKLNLPSFDYTGVVEDLIDPVEINLVNGDSVSGYTIVQIENALKNRTTWHAWKDEIITRYNNPTESNVNKLFDYWN